MSRGRVGRREAVLSWIHKQPDTFTNELLAYEMRLSRKNAGQLLSRLHKSALIERVRIGVYRHSASASHFAYLGGNA